MILRDIEEFGRNPFVVRASIRTVLLVLKVQLGPLLSQSLRSQGIDSDFSLRDEGEYYWVIVAIPS